MCIPLMFAHRATPQGEAMAVVDKPVEDRVCKGWLVDVGMPLIDRKLARDQRGLLVVAILEDLQQIAL